MSALFLPTLLQLPDSQVARATDRGKRFSHQTPALPRASQQPCDGALCQWGRDPRATGGAVGQPGPINATWAEGAIPISKPPVSRGKPKHHRTCIVRGATRAARLSAIPTTSTNTCQARGDPCPPRKSGSGGPQPAHPRSSTTCLLQGAASNALRWLRCSEEGCSPPPAPSQSSPVSNGTQALSSPHSHVALRSRGSCFAPEQATGSFYNQSTTPSRLFFSGKGSS